jgi:hypothetical protein
VGRPTVFLWTAPAAVGNHDGGSGVICQRETASRTTSHLLGRSAGQAAPRRIAVLGNGLGGE